MRSDLSQGKEWAEEINKQLRSGQDPKWPNERMLNLIFEIIY